MKTLNKLISLLLVVVLFVGAFPLDVLAAASSIRQEINIIDGYMSAADGLYATSSAIVELNPSKYSGTVSYHFEVVASTTLSISSNVYLKTKAGATVATVPIPPGTTNPTLIRTSSPFTPTSGATEYVAVIGNESGATKSIKAARIIILQNFAGDANSSATSTQTQIEIGNQETGKSNTTTGTLSFPKYWSYNSSNWDGTLTAYAEVTYQLNSQIASSTTYSVAGSNTYIEYPGTSYIQIEAWGGGAGGGVTNAGGGGGGGGGYARSTTTATGVNHTIEVGAAGTVDQDAGAGNSTFDALVIADGGNGTNDELASTGGTSNTGQVTADGGGGGAANTSPDTSGGGGGAGGPNGDGFGGQGGTASEGGAGGLANGGGAYQNNGGVGGAGSAGTSAGTGGNGGGGGDTSNDGGDGGAPGGGGGGSDGACATCLGSAGQVILTATLGQVGIAVEEDDGSFGGWTFTKQIVSRGDSTSTPSRIRSESFALTNGKHYRLVASTTNSSATYNIYNAKIVVDQATTYPTVFYKLEPQYLLGNTPLSSGTGLQKFLTDWDSTEWTGMSNTYLHAVDAINNSTSIVTLDQADGGGPVTDSTVTNPNYHATSTAMSMPGDENLDVTITTDNGGIYGSRILVRSAATAYTILGDGIDPATNSTIGPGAVATEIGRFSLATNYNGDTVTGLTVTLSPANAYTNIATVDVQTTGGSSKCSTSSISSNTVSLTSCGISVTTTATDYKIMITPKAHGDMLAPASGASYATVATTTDWAGNNTHSGTDTDSATITVDNDSPSNVTPASVSSTYDGQATLSWTNPADTDLAKIIVLRRAGSAVTDTPTEGASYSVGASVGSSVVACSNISTSCTDTGLTNGTAYHYKIFTKDLRGNYSDSGTVPDNSPITPAAAILTQKAYRFSENANIAKFGSDGAASSTSLSDTPQRITADSTHMYMFGVNDTPDWHIEKRLLSDGSLDTSFGTNGVATGASASTDAGDIAIDSTYMYLAGWDGSSPYDWRIEKRKLSNSNLCTAAECGTEFGTGGIVNSTSGRRLFGIAIDSTYMYLAGYDDITKWRIEKRLLSDGSLDTDFGTSGAVTGDAGETSFRMSVAVDSKYMYLTGLDLVGGSLFKFRVEKRLLSDGSLDTNFDGDGIATTTPAAAGSNLYSLDIAIDSNYLYAFGREENSAGSNTYYWHVEKRSLSDGSFDASFGLNGIATSSLAESENASGIDIDSTYMYLVGTDDTSTIDWRIEKRLLSDGSLDSNFGTAGAVVGDGVTTSSLDVYADSLYVYAIGSESYDGGSVWRVEKRRISDGTLADVLLPGNPLATQDNSATLTVANQQFRLRALLRVDTSGASSTKTFKLQFATKSGTCDTSFADESYNDVTGATDISYYDNTLGIDGDALTASTTDPTDSPRTVVSQTYEESNNFTSSAAAIPSGQDGLWDFSLYDKSAPASASYCFRVVESSGAELGAYSVIPEITTYGAVTPPSLTQTHFIWRNDNGSESSASYFTAQDTTISANDRVNLGDRKRLRFLISNGAGAGTATGFQYLLEQASSSCSAWMPISNTETGGTHWVMSQSSNISGEETTTDLADLTNPGGSSFIAGFINDASNKTSAHTLDANQFTELEYSIKSTLNAEIGLQYCFRLTNDGDAQYFGYSNQPQITLSYFQNSSDSNNLESYGSGSLRPGGGASGGGSVPDEDPGTGDQQGGGAPDGGGGDVGMLSPYHWIFEIVFKLLTLNQLTSV